MISNPVDCCSIAQVLCMMVKKPEIPKAVAMSMS